MKRLAACAPTAEASRSTTSVSTASTSRAAASSRARASSSSNRSLARAMAAEHTATVGALQRVGPGTPGTDLDLERHGELDDRAHDAAHPVRHLRDLLV